MRAQPWKSGPLGPRKACGISPGFSPCGAVRGAGAARRFCLWLLRLPRIARRFCHNSWCNDSGTCDGSSDPKRDSTQHANSGGDPGQRDQSRPHAAVWRPGLVLIVSAQGCGFRSSEALQIGTPIMLSDLPGGGSVTATVANCLPLGTDGQYFLIGAPSIRTAMFGGLPILRKIGRPRRRTILTPSGCDGRTAERSEADGEEEGRLAVQFVLRRRRSPSRAQVGSSNSSTPLIHVATNTRSCSFVTSSTPLTLPYSG